MFHRDMIKATIQDLSEQEEELLVKSLEKLNIFFKSKYNLNEKKEVKSANAL